MIKHIKDFTMTIKSKKGLFVTGEFDVQKGDFVRIFEFGYNHNALYKVARTWTRKDGLNTAQLLEI